MKYACIKNFLDEFSTSRKITTYYPVEVLSQLIRFQGFVWHMPHNTATIAHGIQINVKEIDIYTHKLCAQLN